MYGLEKAAFCYSHKLYEPQVVKKMRNVNIDNQIFEYRNELLHLCSRHLFKKENNSAELFAIIRIFTEESQSDILFTN